MYSRRCRLPHYMLDSGYPLGRRLWYWDGSAERERRRGATVTLRLLVDVNDPDGIDENMVNLTIKPTFEQLGLSPEYTLE